MPRLMNEAYVKPAFMSDRSQDHDLGSSSVRSQPRITQAAIAEIPAKAAPPPAPVPTTTDHVNEEAEIANLVERFGQSLQTVLLQAPMRPRNCRSNILNLCLLLCLTSRRRMSP